MKRAIIGLVSLSAFAASSAMAHTGVAAASSVTAGMFHPISGLDHILAMVAVGILAAQQGGRALWWVPASFVALMAGGGVLGVYGAEVPFVEQGILGSVIILGAVVAWGGKFPVAAVMTLVGGLAVFHGHAHGTEMPLNASGVAYSLGFIAVTSALHAVGVGLCIALHKYLEKSATLAARASGAGIALAGAALAVS